MNSQQPFFFHHILSQDVVKTFQKIVQEGYQLRQIQAYSSNGNFALDLFKQSTSPDRQRELSDSGISTEQAVLYFYRSGKKKEGILLRCNMVRPEAPLPQDMPEFMNLYCSNPLLIDTPIHWRADSESELQKNITATLEEYGITTGVNIPVGGKISNIEIFGFKHQGIIKAIVDSWDEEDEERPVHDADLDVDAFLIIEMRDIQTKLIIRPPFALQFRELNEPYPLGELYPYQIPYISRYRVYMQE